MVDYLITNQDRHQWNIGFYYARTSNGWYLCCFFCNSSSDNFCCNSASESCPVVSRFPSCASIDSDISSIISDKTPLSSVLPSVPAASPWASFSALPRSLAYISQPLSPSALRALLPHLRCGTSVSCCTPVLLPQSHPRKYETSPAFCNFFDCIRFLIFEILLLCLKKAIFRPALPVSVFFPRAF